MISRSTSGHRQRFTGRGCICSAVLRRRLLSWLQSVFAVSGMGLDPDFVREWQVKAYGQQFFDVPVSKMNRDELLALVAWLAQKETDE